MTAGQQRAFDPGPATGGLRDNQQFVLELLQRNPGGMLAIDIGRELHLNYKACDFCSPERLCKFAKANALTILESLGTSGRQLVIRRKSGYWQSLYPAEDERYDPATAPWPEHF